MNKSQLILKAKRVLDERKYQAESRCEQTLATLRMNGDWSECEHALRSAQVKAALGNEKEQALSRAEIRELQIKRKQLLKKYGVTESDLTPQYHCPDCNDTGYAGAKICHCLQEEIRKAIVADSNVPSAEYTFKNSTEKLEHNKKVYGAAEKIVVGGKRKNILLFGATGSGKTYLLCSAANACADNGKSVTFLTAFGLNSLFLDCYLGSVQARKLILDSLTETDVLVIDDLGTEKNVKNVTQEYLYVVLNERLTANKQTFVSTNLELQQIRDRYDERIFSRLVDQKTTLVARLEGEDKRLSGI